MFKFLLAVCLLASPFSCRYSEADQPSISVAYLLGEFDLTGIRVSYHPYSFRLTQIDWLGELDLDWDISVNFWEYDGDNKHETNFAVALSPVLSGQFAYLLGKYPVKWEVGTGISVLNHAKFASNNMGAHYQFENRLGAVLEIPGKHKQSLALRLMHYSNAGTNKNNPGINFLSFCYDLKF